MKEKLITLTRVIFAYGMSTLILLAFLVAVVFVVLFLIGMPGSGAVIAFLRRTVLPAIYVSAIVLTIIGIINMYLRGEQLYKLELPKHKKE